MRGLIIRPQIKILPYRSVKEYNPELENKTNLLISIGNGDVAGKVNRLKHKKAFFDILGIDFLDIEISKNEDINSINERKRIYGDLLFNELHIQKIMNFVELYSNKKIDILVINCSEGKRRSLSVGLVLAKYIFKDYVQYQNLLNKNKIDMFGNPYIYKKFKKWATINRCKYKSITQK